jgi:GT2 family glycosyltransferase/glycosyltransferase involved in cell wall biosynthesis/2-polyprenyl-3-methyl-5-hydroxy-6-metoxy-1,4-benzoquinol methylase
MKHTYDPQRNLWTRPDFSGIAYSDGSEIEARMLRTMQTVKDKSVYSIELASHICDWPSEYHLTTSRHCLMRPVPFEAGQSVLELGCGCGAITRHLGELGLNVTAVEGGAKRAEIAAERVRDLPNVKVVFDDLVQFQSEEKFDWVTLIGVLEYSPMFAPGEDPVSAYLQQALSYLKPGGRLVIAIENQLGLKYFNGCGEDHVNLPFYGPQGLYAPGGPVTFGKQQLKQRLLDIGFAGVDYFFPYPDYKIPQAIVSESAFTTPGFKVADMLLRMDPRDYTGRPLRLFSEQLVARELEDNGVLSDFSNSFLLIARQTDTPAVPTTAPIAWCFSLNRLSRYKTETTFHVSGDQVEVRKTRVAPPSTMQPAASDKLQHHLGTSLYSKGRLQAWQLLKAKLRPYSETDFAAAFVPYARHLLDQSQQMAGANPALIESWQTAGSLLDLTPFNVIETASGPQAIDMEWEVSGPIPTGWILLRSIVHSLTIGLTPEEAADTTLGSLLQSIIGALGMQYSPSSFRQWAQLEQEFIESVCGVKTRLLTPDISIALFCPYRKLDIDRWGTPGSATSGHAVLHKQIVVEETQAANALSPTGHIAVSAVVMCYQQRDLVQRALQSLLTQDYPIDEIIISDDCSTDGTIDAILAMEPQLRQRCNNLVIRQNPKNLGIVAHFNVLFEQARNEFIVYFAGDDISEPQRVRRLAEHFRSVGCPRYYLVHSDVRMIDDADNLGDLFKPPVITDRLDFMGTALSARLHVGATAAFTRALWADYGGFEERWVYEDLILGWRAAMHGHYHYLPESLLRYRSGGVTFQTVSPEKQRRHLLSLYRQRLIDTTVAETAGLRTDLGDVRYRLSVSLNALESSQAVSEFDLSYVQWRATRQILPEDLRQIGQELASLSDTAPRFQIVIRLPSDATPALADTLDALNGQYYPHWRVDLVTSLPPPAGMEAVACVGWHTIDAAEDTAQAINTIVANRPGDWIIELPPGVQPDPLLFWRLAREISRTPDAVAYFVDDDCRDQFGERGAPRFKPGTNPAALKTADLAGPLCIRSDAWQSIGGAPSHAGSPWFAQLLRLADQTGWAAIRHVPDVLLTYPQAFPADVQTCLETLIAHHDAKGLPIEIVPGTEQSWNIQPLPAKLPAVSIAILSFGQLDLLSRCFDSVINQTTYPSVEILVVLDTCQSDPGLDDWLSAQEAGGYPIRTVRSVEATTYAERCNLAVREARYEHVVLMREEAVIIQPAWLEELAKTSMENGIAAVSPRMIVPGSGNLFHAGLNLGLVGLAGTPSDDQTRLGEPGYLDMLSISRDVQVLPTGCFLIRKAAYEACGGMDGIAFGDHFAEIDLSLKLATQSWRIVFQPLATLVYGGATPTPEQQGMVSRAEQAIRASNAEKLLFEKWGNDAANTSYWNPSLSLSKAKPILEVDTHPQWQYLPTDTPRFLARTLPNGQGIFRVTAPLRALRKQGLAAECVWEQEASREPSMSELVRLAPDSVIVQHYVQDRQLKSLNDWSRLKNRPFTIFTMDDLLTDLPPDNFMRQFMAPNSRACLKYALDRCDRLVVSTEFLADYYRSFISDIRVVPNRLEQEVWLPLTSRKRVSPRPRIGWAGGTTHHGDLLLLREVIEQTRGEADWVFFGMCPDELRPLVAEFHPLAAFHEYPARLASLNLDIAVAPLQDHPFNHGKSNLRLLEYGALGIPVVCSDMTPYRNSPACCVPNDPVAWVKALRDRIHDAPAREAEGLVLKRWVRQHYLLENHLDQWLTAYLPD